MFTAACHFISKYNRKVNILRTCSCTSDTSIDRQEKKKQWQERRHTHLIVFTDVQHLLSFRYTQILQIIAVVLMTFGLIGKVFNCIIFLRPPVRSTGRDAQGKVSILLASWNNHGSSPLSQDDLWYISITLDIYIRYEILRTRWTNQCLGDHLCPFSNNRSLRFLVDWIRYFSLYCSFSNDCRMSMFTSTNAFTCLCFDCHDDALWSRLQLAHLLLSESGD